MFRKCSGPVPGFTDTPDSVSKTENRPGPPGTPLITKITQTSTKPKKNKNITNFICHWKTEVESDQAPGQIDEFKILRK